MGVPCAAFYRLIISFADLSTVQAAISPGTALRVRARVSLTDFLSGSVSSVTSPQQNEARNIATSLLKQHVERHLEQRGLKRFQPSASASFYFPSGLIPNDKVPYTAASGRRTNKNVVGRSNRNKVNWHLAMKVNVVLGPPAVVRFKPYVCFSENGQTAINDPKRTSAIRRRFCKNWWNQHWRQLQEAFCVFLADGGEIVINLDGPEKLALSAGLLELVATRKMPDDLNIADEPDDPVEPDDDEPDEADPGLEADFGDAE